MKTYVKKPVYVTAVQWTGYNADEIKDFAGDACEIEEGVEPCGTGLKECFDLYIKTLEGKMFAGRNSYIIRGVEGEFYPCKESVFHKTYEEFK